MNRDLFSFLDEKLDNNKPKCGSCKYYESPGECYYGARVKPTKAFFACCENYEPD